MKKWMKVVLILLALDVGYWGFTILRFRNVKANKSLRAQRYAIKPRDFNATNDPDAAIKLKAENPVSLQDEKNLKGRALWVSAGGQMDFFPYNGKSVEFGHAAGTLLGAEKIVVSDAVEQPAPKSAGARFPDADAEILLIFERPNDPKNPTREYAVAVGDREGRDYNVLTDQLFFYDDPHQLYSHWGAKIWKAIDEHNAVLGMTERQLQLALGTVNTPRGDIMGDRAVEFDDQGKPKLVTLVDGKATEIRDESR